MCTSTFKFVIRLVTLTATAFALCCEAAEKWPKINNKWPQSENGIKVFAPLEDQAVLSNKMACFTVFAEASDLKKSPPLFFEWRKNGIVITNATGPSYMISNALPSDVGFYQCVVRRGSPHGPSVVVGTHNPEDPGARLFVLTDTNTAVAGPIQAGQGTKTCVGSYKGWVTFKTTTGSTWWTAPAGKTNCTITDLTFNSYNPPYTPVVHAVENTSLNVWCGPNSVSFPVVAGRKYQLTTFIINTMPPPRTGDTLQLDITWGP